MQCLPLRLEADGLAPLDLSGAGPIIGNYLDVGDAITRIEAIDRPGGDGTIDTTSLTGARVVTLGADVNPNNPAAAGMSRWALTQQLRAFTAPHRRPRLFIQFSPTDPELMVTLRRSQFTDTWQPQSVGRSSVLTQWVCPDGVLESAAINTAVARASASDDSIIGVAFPIVFPVAWPAAPISGSASVVNAGTATAYPVLRLRGPMSDRIEIIHVDQGRQIVLDGTTVPAGSYIEIDTRTHRITLNGDPTQSRRQFLLFPDTTWWALTPGEQSIRLVCETFDSPAQVEILWRDAFY